MWKELYRSLVSRWTYRSKQEKRWPAAGYPITNAPVAPDGVRHTSYVLVQDSRPLTVRPVPMSNFLGTTSEHQQDVTQQLKDIGFTLVASKG